MNCHSCHSEIKALFEVKLQKIKFSFCSLACLINWSEKVFMQKDQEPLKDYIKKIALWPKEEYIDDHLLIGRLIEEVAEQLKTEKHIEPFGGGGLAGWKISMANPELFLEKLKKYFNVADFFLTSSPLKEQFPKEIKILPNVPIHVHRI